MEKVIYRRLAARYMAGRFRQGRQRRQARKGDAGRVVKEGTEDRKGAKDMPDLFYYRLASITREYMSFPINSIPCLGLGRGPGTCGKPKIEFWRHLEADYAKQGSVRSTCCKETWNKGGVFSRSLVCRRGVSWHGRSDLLVPYHQKGVSWHGRLSFRDQAQ